MRYGHIKGVDGPLAIVDGDTAHHVAAGFPELKTLDDLIEAGPGTWREVEQACHGLPVVGSPAWGAPLRRPSKVVCIGLNYRDHAAEQDVPIPTTPLVFAKFPSCIVGPDEPIVWSAELTTHVDYEAELAVIVGQRLRDADEDEAIAGVFGYTAANDVSARDLQRADGQFVRGKSLDTFLPLGPTVVTREAFGDPGTKRIAARLNGDGVQESSTEQLIFSVPSILSFLSRHMTLCPGDLVLTGTPAGVGAFRAPPLFMVPGDRIEVEIEGIGVLSNPIGEATPLTWRATSEALGA